MENNGTKGRARHKCQCQGHKYGPTICRALTYLDSLIHVPALDGLVPHDHKDVSQILGGHGGCVYVGVCLCVCFSCSLPLSMSHGSWWAIRTVPLHPQRYRWLEAIREVVEQRLKLSELSCC